MGVVVTFVSVLVVLLAALLYPNVSTTIVNFGTFDTIRHQKEPNCYFEQSEDLTGCENGQVDEDGISYFACARNLTERRLWWPPVGAHDKSPYSHGGITTYDFKVSFD
jgi:coproporphyrinogen III oxidase